MILEKKQFFLYSSNAWHNYWNFITGINRSIWDKRLHNTSFVRKINHFAAVQIVIEAKIYLTMIIEHFANLLFGATGKICDKLINFELLAVILCNFKLIKSLGYHELLMAIPIAHWNYDSKFKLKICQHFFSSSCNYYCIYLKSIHLYIGNSNETNNSKNWTLKINLVK